MNDAPVAIDDAASTAEDTVLVGSVALQSNDTDLDGDTLSVAAGSVGTFATAQGGSITVAANGTYTYTPAANFHGTDTFDYTVSDGTATDVVRLTITVSAVNDAPVAIDDAASTAEDTVLVGSVALQSNDTDLDGDTLSVAAGSVGTFATAQGGSITVAANGTYTYTPAANFHGTDTFDYTVSDGTATDVGRLTITVSAVNDAPVAIDDAASTAEDTVLVGSVALQSNDTDLDGDTLSVAAGSVADVRHGAGRLDHGGGERDLHVHPGCELPRHGHV